MGSSFHLKKRPKSLHRGAQPCRMQRRKIFHMPHTLFGCWRKLLLQGFLRVGLEISIWGTVKGKPMTELRALGRHSSYN